MARLVIGFLVLFCCTTEAGVAKDPFKSISQSERRDALRRAQVWMPTSIPAMNIKAGPQEVSSFPPSATVNCDYVAKEMTGKTPKFTCAVAPGDEVKVKYGENNGEVYGEVAATRLLWALGFGADRMYPVAVVCRGCSADPFRAAPKPVAATAEPITFDPAAIERPLPGDAMESGNNQGWSWTELSFVDQTAGGAPLAHRDALKLIAAFLQHTDSKPEQQRLICLDSANGTPPTTGKALCARPFLMMSDVGRTFGKANMFNKDMPGSVDLKSWAAASVWKGDKGCQANISKSMTGTLDHPMISEEGRKFLADLLVQLSDRQIRDLFEVSRFTRRDRSSTVEDWVNTFKQKRTDIVTRSCASA